MKKSDCTPEQWAAHRAYQRAYSQRPEAAAKRHAKNQTDEKRRQERERYQKRKAAGKIAKHERTPEQKRERYVAAQKKYWTPEKIAEIEQRRRDREAAEPERIERRKKYHSEYARKRNTNFTPEQYATALAIQGGGCALCGRTERLHADHDHATGEPRGILCFSCNATEGRIAASGLSLMEYFEKLKAYLEKPPLSD